MEDDNEKTNGMKTNSLAKVTNGMMMSIMMIPAYTEL